MDGGAFSRAAAPAPHELACYWIGLRMAAPSSLPGPDSCAKATRRRFLGSSPGLSFSWTSCANDLPFGELPYFGQLLNDRDVDQDACRHSLREAPATLRDRGQGPRTRPHYVCRSWHPFRCELAAWRDSKGRASPRQYAQGVSVSSFALFNSCSSSCNLSICPTCVPSMMNWGV